jgi:hypothetical protein
MKQYISVVCLMDILLGGELSPICPLDHASSNVSDILVKC